MAVLSSSPWASSSSARARREIIPDVFARADPLRLASVPPPLEEAARLLHNQHSLLYGIRARLYYSAISLFACASSSCLKDSCPVAPGCCDARIAFPLLRPPIIVPPLLTNIASVPSVGCARTQPRHWEISRLGVRGATHFALVPLQILRCTDDATALDAIPRGLCVPGRSGDHSHATCRAIARCATSGIVLRSLMKFALWILNHDRCINFLDRHPSCLCAFHIQHRDLPRRSRALSAFDGRFRAQN